MTEVSTKKVLIVGGGKSAYHKVRSFTEFGADVTVIAEEVSPDIRRVSEGILVIEKSFEESDLRGIDIVIAATGNRMLNREIATAARRRGILVNAVDDKEYCDFIFPAILKKENYSVAVCTEGKSPLMAQEIRNEIARTLSGDYDAAVGELGQMRESVISSTAPGERMTKFREEAEKLIGKKRIRIGTRGSALALAQTEMVMEALEEKGIASEAVIITTEGDKNKEKPLYEFGGKSVFVSAFEDAILKGRIDIAIHSAKDMPAELPDGLSILACLRREDPADVLVSLAGRRSEDIRLIGTSSLRRKAMIEAESERYEARPLRGNVPSRINKLRRGEYDAVILAAAGLRRLDLDAEPDLRYEKLDPSEFIPAAGQGIIAVEGLADSRITGVIRELNDRQSELALIAERSFMKAIGADCHDSVAAYAVYREDHLMDMHAMKYDNGVFRYGSECRDVEDEDASRSIAEETAKQVLGGGR